MAELKCFNLPGWLNPDILLYVYQLRNTDGVIWQYVGDAVHKAELLLNPDHPSKNKQLGNLVMQRKL